MTENNAGQALFDLIYTVFISAIISVVCVFIYHERFAPEIVTVDIKGYVEAQKELYVAGKIDEMQLKKKIQKLSEILKALPENEKVIAQDAAIQNIRTIQP